MSDYSGHTVYPKAVNVSGGIKTEDGRVLFGLDAETYLKMKSKEDPEHEKKIGAWVEEVLGEELLDKSDLYQSLRNGIALCKLLNCIQPGIIKKYNTKLFRGQLHALSERENITIYLEACWKLGLAASDIFVVSDLHGRQGMSSVLNNLTALSQVAQIMGIKATPIGPKKIDLAQKKAPKFEVNVLSGSVFVGEVEEDDVEEMEEELRQLTLKLEEAQRTIKQLESSKEHLNSLLDVEKKYFVEAEKESKILRSAQGPGADEQFVEDLKRQRDKMIAELEDLRRRIASDPEVQTLKGEIQKMKESLAQRASAVGESSSGTAAAATAAAEEAKRKMERKVEETKKLRDRISFLEKKNSELKSVYDEEKNGLKMDLENSQKEKEKLNKFSVETEKKKNPYTRS